VAQLLAGPLNPRSSIDKSTFKPQAHAVCHVAHGSHLQRFEDGQQLALYRRCLPHWSQYAVHAN
jgi:hypothetical protein